MLNVIKRLLQNMRRERQFFALAVLLAVGGGALSLVVPVYIGKAVDCMLGTGLVDRARLLEIALKLLGIIAASAVMQWGMQLCTNRISFRTVLHLRTEVFAKLQRVPISYVDGHVRGDLIQTAVNDLETIADGLLQGFSQLLSGVVTIVGTLIFMLTISVPITILVVALTPLSLVVASQIAKRAHAACKAQSEQKAWMTAFAEEQIGNQKLVQAFCYEERAEAAFADINREVRRTGIKATFCSALTNPSTRFVNGVLYAVIGTVGALSVIGSAGIFGSLSVGRLTAFLSYASQYTKPFNEISGVVAELQNAVASANRVFAVLDAPEEPEDADIPALQGCDGSITLEDVSFSYRPEVKLLEHVTLDIVPGQKIAIVGPTGCGKTTLINLLLRFYDPQQGRILVSGQDIQAVSRDSLRAAYGMVLQETWLFSGTIAENIAYGKPDASREEIIAAAKAVHAHSYIMRLPLGYDTPVTEEGVLSQGQRQLISVARIMLTDPPVLILDEATSSLDIRTEERVRKAFDKLMEGKTALVIAHRLSTIQNADRILVMRDGNIVEQGTHSSLLQAGGFYAQLYRSQFATT